MPLSMAKAMAECLRQAAHWMTEEAKLHERGEIVRIRDGKDESRIYAQDLLHRARNMEASAAAFERVMARKEP